MLTKQVEKLETSKVAVLTKQVEVSTEEKSEPPTESRLYIEYENSNNDIAPYTIAPMGRKLFWGVNPRTGKEAWLLEAWESDSRQVRLFTFGCIRHIND